MSNDHQIDNRGGIFIGGNNSGNNTINQAPPPDVKLLGEVKSSENSDGTYTQIIVFEIVAPYPPGQLLIQAFGTDIVELDVGALRTGIVLGGHSGRRQDFVFTTLLHPFGAYELTVQTKTKRWVKIEMTFD